MDLPVDFSLFTEGLNTPEINENAINSLDRQMEISYDLDSLMSGLMNTGTPQIMAPSATPNSCIVGDEKSTNTLEGLSATEDFSFWSNEEPMTFSLDDIESADICATDINTGLAPEIKLEAPSNKPISDTTRIFTDTTKIFTETSNKLEGVGLVVDPAETNLPPELKKVSRVIIIYPKNNTSGCHAMATQQNQPVQVPIISQGVPSQPEAADSDKNSVLHYVDASSVNVLKTQNTNVRNDAHAMKKSFKLELPASQVQTNVDSVSGFGAKENNLVSDIQKHMDFKLQFPRIQPQATCIVGSCVKNKLTTQKPMDFKLELSHTQTHNNLISQSLELPCTRASDVSVVGPSTKNNMITQKALDVESSHSLAQNASIFQPCSKESLITQRTFSSVEEIAEILKATAEPLVSTKPKTPAVATTRSNLKLELESPSSCQLPFSNLNTPEANNILTAENSNFNLLDFVLTQNNITVEAEVRPLKRNIPTLSSSPDSKRPKLTVEEPSTSATAIANTRVKPEMSDKFVINRIKNNAASKRSRLLRKQKKAETEEYLEQLEQRNNELKREYRNMINLVATLKEILMKIIVK